MESLRQRVNPNQTVGEEAAMDFSPTRAADQLKSSCSSVERYGWLYIPAIAIVTTLLLSTLYVLRLEQAQVVSQEATIRELKMQIRSLRQELLSAKSIGQCSSGSVTKLQDEVHKLERVAENLKAGKTEADKQLQEMISRVSILQSERNKLKTALRAMKAELADSSDDVMRTTTDTDQ